MTSLSSLPSARMTCTEGRKQFLPRQRVKAMRRPSRDQAWLATKPPRGKARREVSFPSSAPAASAPSARVKVRTRSPPGARTDTRSTTLRARALGITVVAIRTAKTGARPIGAWSRALPMSLFNPLSLQLQEGGGSRPNSEWRSSRSIRTRSRGVWPSQNPLPDSNRRPPLYEEGPCVNWSVRASPSQGGCRGGGWRAVLISLSPPRGGTWPIGVRSGGAAP